MGGAFGPGWDRVVAEGTEELGGGSGNEAETGDRLPGCANAGGDAAFRGLLEEYRVSVFAHELGTAQPVSAKRLEVLVEQS